LIKTSRLLLRHLQLEDTEAVLSYRMDPEVARYQSWEPQSIEEVSAFIRTQQAVKINTPGTWFQLAITRVDNGQVIGDLGLHFPEGDERQSEIGFTLAPAYQGQGYASEAVRAVLTYLFETLKKHRVFASADPRNLSSIKLMQRVGMRQEGHLVESLWFKGAWADDVLFAILEKEWFPPTASHPAAESTS
jgi:RimJ/RimL family protein N-acetyltransferase